MDGSKNIFHGFVTSMDLLHSVYYLLFNQANVTRIGHDKSYSHNGRCLFLVLSTGFA